MSPVVFSQLLCALNAARGTTQLQLLAGAEDGEWESRLRLKNSIILFCSNTFLCLCISDYISAFAFSALVVHNWCLPRSIITSSVGKIVHIKQEYYQNVISSWRLNFIQISLALFKNCSTNRFADVTRQAYISVSKRWGVETNIQS